MATAHEYRAALSKLTPEQREGFRKKLGYGPENATVDDILKTLAEVPELEHRAVLWLNELLPGENLKTEAAKTAQATIQGARYAKYAVWFGLLTILGLWLAYQQVEIGRLQLAEQRRQAAEQREKERQDQLRPRVRVFPEKDMVRVIIERLDPVTGFETTTELLMPEKSWKEMEAEIRAKKLREPIPPKN